MNKDELVTIRDMLPEDKNFILATWLRGTFYGESVYSNMPKSLFMDKYHKVLEFLLTNPNTKVRVACLKDDADVILGYSVFTKDSNTLHWVFVKKSWRGIGIARDIVPSSITTITNLTKIGNSIAKKKQLTFDPFIV